MNRSQFKRVPKAWKPSRKTLSRVAADDLFSKLIRARDKYCVNCGTTQRLECSHFFGRSHWATRFDPLNCVTLCGPSSLGLGCHPKWEVKKKPGGAYWRFMIKRLGHAGLEALRVKAEGYKARPEAIQEVRGR